jgi:hypothetical protein
VVALDILSHRGAKVAYVLKLTSHGSHALAQTLDVVQSKLEQFLIWVSGTGVACDPTP